jgi:hypothetical protein
VSEATAYDDEINGGIITSTVMAESGDNQGGSYGYEKAYLVYMDKSGLDMDISFSRIVSFFDVTEFVDFSSRITLNDDGQGSGADQFMPSVAVDEQGTVHVAFYDRRNDPDNLHYDVYYTSSTDLGDNWTPNERVTTVSSDPSLPYVDGQIGNRIGAAVWQGQTIITWTDTRNGDADIFASSLTPTGTSDEQSPLPDDITLDNLYPNPFNNSVEIGFTASSARQVRLELLDLMGRRVKELYNGTCRIGVNRLVWDGKNSDSQTVGSGIYFVSLISDGLVQTKKAVLLK